MLGKAKAKVTREWLAQAVLEANGTPVPNNSTLVAVDYNADNDTYELVFESRSFPDVHEGETVPLLDEISEVDE
jgi:hypothetical protein